jgi:uncharacterized protein YdaU (DUF1376 family)
MTDHDLGPFASPEELEIETKKIELSRLSEELAERELDLEEARLSLRQFHRRYFSTIGEKYVVLDDLLAQIAELAAEKNPSNQNAQTSARRARDQAAETAREFKGIQEKQEPIASSTQASDECKTLYRHIASIIHPDKALHEETKEIRTRLMAELNDSYAKRDIDGMKRILAEWQNSPDAVSGVGPAVELVRVIRAISQVRRRIAEVDKTLSDILTSDMYSLMVAVHEADLQGRDMLNEMSRDLEDRITQARHMLASLE